MPGARSAIFLGAALVLSGAGFDSPSLLVAGVAMIGLAGAAVGWVELASNGLSLERLPGPARVIEGQAYPLRIEARGGRLPPPGGELSDPLLDRPLPVGPRWSGRLAVEIPSGRRGRRPLGPTRLRIRDSLGLWSREVASAGAGELLVLPRIEAVKVASRGARAARIGLLAGIEDGAASGRFDARTVELEVDGLRPHREGSPASRIHWPAVARSGELIERRLVAGGDVRPLIVLDASNPADLDSLDAAVRAASSLGFRLAAGGGCSILLPGDGRPLEIESDQRAWSQVHARLAVVEPGAPAPLPARASRPGAVLWVTANSRPRLPATLRSGGSGVRYLVAPASLLSRGRAAFSVAGCEGRVLGVPARRSLGRVA